MFSFRLLFNLCTHLFCFRLRKLDIKGLSSKVASRGVGAHNITWGMSRGKPGLDQQQLPLFEEATWLSSELLLLLCRKVGPEGLQEEVQLKARPSGSFAMCLLPLKAQRGGERWHQPIANQKNEVATESVLLI